MTPHGHDAAPPPGGGSDLSATYARVLIVQVIVLTALYWLGRHFG